MLANTNYCLALLLLFVACSVTALRCYTCSYTNGGLDKSCILDPESAHQITNCSKMYCIIVRQELVRPAGQVVSFIRDCQDKPLYLNAVKTDSTFKTYHRSCTSDLCNDSDGTHAATNVDPNFGAAANTVIKGKPSYYRAKTNKN
uniref:Protein sleepless n=1 Tax=Glossina pallidipes TaxID=7398 RepID=A0A1A9ZGV7_GLOPL